MTYVIAHERMHLRRQDHWWKPMGYLLLSVYWFHPVILVAYILLCRDIEFACDESVIRSLGEHDKKLYSDALLCCSIPRKMIAACPLAFGKVGVKDRIKAVLNYRKQACYIIVLAIVSSMVVVVCFLTNSIENEPDLSFLNYENAISSVAEVKELTDENIVYNGKEYKKSELSNATLHWLKLSEQERMASSYLPPEFIVFEENWGITLTTENITSASATIVCTQSGGKPTGELQTGSWYILENWTQENGWKEVDYVLQGDVAWTQEGWLIQKDSTSEWKINWKTQKLNRLWRDNNFQA